MDPSLISAQVSPQDAGLLTSNVAASSYLPRPHTVTIDKKKDERILTPNSTTQSFGGNCSFDVPRFGDRLAEIVLTVKVGIPTATGATFVRLCDNFLLSAIKNVLVTYGGQEIENINPLWRIYKTLNYLNDEKKEALQNLHRAGLTQAQRNTLATGEQEFDLSIPVYWEDIYCHYPILNALYDFLKFTFNYNPVSALVETDGTNPQLAILSENLKIHIIHNIAPERNRVVALTKTPTGITYLCDGQQFENNLRIPAGTTEIQFSMRNLKQPSKELAFFFRPYNQVNATAPQPVRDYFDFSDPALLPDEIDIETSGVKILRRITNVKDYMINFYNYRNYSARPNTIVRLPFADDPEVKNSSNGHLTLGSTGENIVNFKWNTATAIDIRLDIMSVYHRFILHQKGDLHVIFRS